MTNGPFTEPTELVAGYYLIDCAARERAGEIARRLREAPCAPPPSRR